jgi:uncharacterized tellurite resistance protein B-like protein
MIQKIKQFFEQNISFTEENNDEQQLQLATAALFIEMMLQDGKVHDNEKISVLNAIKHCFNISDNEANVLFSLAEDELKHSTDYFQFTQLINKNFTPAQKVKVIENLWAIAYADSHLDDFEEHMVRKIAELIYVPHTQFIKAKLKVQERLKSQGN